MTSIRKAPTSQKKKCSTLLVQFQRKKISFNRTESKRTRREFPLRDERKLSDDDDVQNLSLSSPRIIRIRRRTMRRGLWYCAAKNLLALVNYRTPHNALVFWLLFWRSASEPRILIFIVGVYKYYFSSTKKKNTTTRPKKEGKEKREDSQKGNLIEENLFFFKFFLLVRSRSQKSRT